MSKRNGRKNDEMVLIIINILIAVVSFFTFILGNITIAFGEKFNSGLYVLFGYIIIFVPIIVSIIFNIVMAFVKTGRTIKNNFLNFLTIITQTSHPKSGHKACINAGWDTNQLIS